MSPRTPLKRRTVLAAAAMLMPSTAWLKTRGNPMSAIKVEERSLSELQVELRTGRLTAPQVTAAYLARIESIDRAGPHLRSVIETNPDATAIARSLDLGRRARGPLHGLPILIKDNVDTHDKMQTTAGSLALVGSKPPTDAFVVQQLRAAGAVILGKTNLSEWANIRSSQSTSGWSARGGLTRNPHALDRNTSGSSSGSAAAVAASLCAAAVGSETDGSILSPSSICGIVGLKPTVGLISRSGVIPIAHSQDTLGPMARSVRDCAILLGAMTGFDPDDAAMQGSAPHSLSDYTGALNANALKGARLGVARQFFGFHDQTEQAYAPVLEALKRAGAVLVDPVTLPAIETIGEAELTVLLYELKADLAVYLKRLGPDAPVKSLADVIAFNQKNASREMAWFGQDLFEKAQTKGPLTDTEYLDARAKCLRIARTEGIEAVMREQKLDALIAPTGGPAWRIDTVIGDHFVGSSTTPAAVAGTPAITVPAAMLRGLPLGLTFFGNAWSEAKLLGLAYAFEQATKARRAPSYAKSVDA
ncbi:MAG: amidase [Burkholderiaceae bacterium]